MNFLRFSAMKYSFNINQFIVSTEYLKMVWQSDSLPTCASKIRYTCRLCFLPIRIPYLYMLKFTLVALFFSVSLFSEAKQAKLIACIDDHPPYQYLGETPYGTHISALKILAQVLEKKLIFIQSPNFARCVAFLRTGYVDVIAGFNKTEERKEFAFYAPFKLADKLTVITNKDLMIDKYSDFSGKIIGVPRGATYFSKFDNDETLNKVSIQNERVGLALLVKKRIDLMMANPDMLNLHFEDIAKNELKASTIKLEKHRTKYTYFGFSEKISLGLSKEEIITAINVAFEKGRFIASQVASD